MRARYLLLIKELFLLSNNDFSNLLNMICLVLNKRCEHELDDIGAVIP